jgi:hypothetical protein
MAYDIIHKNSTVSGTPPTAGEVEVGEIAINAADAELYTKDTDGTIQAFKSKFTQTGTGAVARTIESKLKDVVSVKDFGAAGDGVTDDTTAIQNAINAAIAAGYKAVFLPVGDYVVSSTIYLHTSSGQSFLGAGLVGEDPLECKILFKPAAVESVCFEIRGGSGNNTNKHLTNLFVKPFDVGYNNNGVAVYVHGQCFTNLTNVKVETLNHGLHLCNNDVGSFTEFTTLQNCRFVNCNQAVRIERKAGNSSFHGTRFHDVMINIQDGQYGLYITGTDGTVFLYNSFFDINFTCENAGTPVAIYAHNCNTQNNAGFIRSENPTYFQATSTGEFHMRGPGNSITNVNYTVGTPDGAFIFDDNRSNSAFIASDLSSYAPRPLPSSLVGRNTNGDFPAVFRIAGSNIESIGIATYSFANNGAYFGSIGLNDTLEDFTPKIFLDTVNGQKIRSYNSSFFLTDNTNTTDQLKLNGGRVGGNLGRSIDYSISADAGVPQSVTTIANESADRASLLYVRLVGSQYEARFQLAFNHDGLGGTGTVTTFATHKQFNNTAGGVSGLTFTVNASGQLVVNITTDRAITAKIRELGYGTQLVS